MTHRKWKCLRRKKKRLIKGLIKASFLISELNPMPTEEICIHFNELRSDMVLLYELKTALATCEYELQTLRHQYEALNPGKVSGTNS
jgi:DNA methyltransferase 1-associated protein 1